MTVLARRVVGWLTRRRPPLGVAVQAAGGLLLVLGVGLLAGVGWAVLAGGAGLLCAGTLIEAG